MTNVKHSKEKPDLSRFGLAFWIFDSIPVSGDIAATSLDSSSFVRPGRRPFQFRSQNSEFRMRSQGMDFSEAWARLLWYRAGDPHVGGGLFEKAAGGWASSEDSQSPTVLEPSCLPIETTVMNASGMDRTSADRAHPMRADRWWRSATILGPGAVTPARSHNPVW